MSYTLEEIFSICGKNNFTALVVFYPNTLSAKKIGAISGTFYYTSSERLVLEKKIDDKSTSATFGNVKFKVFSDNVSGELAQELIKTGIPTSEIMEVKYYPVATEVISPDGIKELPKPIIINIPYTGNGNADLMLVNLNQYKLEAGYLLAPFEIHKHNAALLNLYRDKIPKTQFEELFVDKQTGKIKSAILYHHLYDKLIYSTLTESEQQDWDELVKKRTAMRVEILMRELQKSSERFKTIGIDYHKALSYLNYISAAFEDETLILSKRPIWWDFERFLHIYMRHVKETQIGERFIDKSVFPYKLNDIKELIAMVLKSISKEIDKHFELTPDKPFKRHGEMAVYFQADYYAIHIGTDGRLLAFYKLN